MKNLIALIFSIAALTAFSQNDCDLENYKGWYSAQQHQIGGATLYTTIEGDTVLVTEVAPDTTAKPSGNFNDYEYIGIVCKYVKLLDNGMWSRGTVLAYESPYYPPVYKNILNYMREYKAWCEEEVEMEVQQTGQVTYDMIPVRGENTGETLFYELAAVDTTWNEVECPEFKEADERYVLYSGFGDSLRIKLGDTWYGDGSGKKYITVSRPYKCTVKRRQVVFGEKFFEWLSGKL